ncbi:PREDICTED: L10-interacting MYB domain-containing protein-like [Nicotiana attenuata]|uniref:L10-interacting MYB domain-containing protein-like n=1 Tax=Nicotiana attenuata TaxID=49451 RepID=UPI0009056E9C|nr:PREDICTED: L10-interacting MYB domain-containing protein-like [Nicotiana attenuata]
MTLDNNSEKAKWDAETTELLLNICVEEILAGNRPGTHFSRLGWSNLVQKFNDKTRKNYDKVKLKNKWDNLKGTWKEWDTLVGKETGLGWDPDKKIIQASADWWDRKIKENPNVEKFREKGLQHLQLMNSERKIHLVTTTMAIHNFIRRRSSTDKEFNYYANEDITTEIEEGDGASGIPLEMQDKSSTIMEALRDRIRDEIVEKYYHV